MEEKEKTSQSNKLSYDELEKVAKDMQERLFLAERKLNSIDFATVRLTWLFKVMDNYNKFSSEFTKKCAKEIEEMLTLDTPEKD